VCPIAETAPRRMGAARTCARRYALFTLVGIAGEDDLDVPDLGGGNSDTRPGLDIQTSPKPMERPFATSDASRKGKVIRPPRIVLATQQSETLRDRLVAELSDLKSPDEAADWVHVNPPAKNTLTSADAKLVEATFRERLAAIEEERSHAGPSPAVDSPSDEPSPAQSQAFNALDITAPQTTIVQRRRAIAKTIRLRDKSTASSSPRNPASSAVARPPKRIIFASPNPGR
jgi:hypothetical protein